MSHFSKRQIMVAKAMMGNQSHLRKIAEATVPTEGQVSAMVADLIGAIGFDGLSAASLIGESRLKVLVKIGADRVSRVEMRLIFLLWALRLHPYLLADFRTMVLWGRMKDGRAEWGQGVGKASRSGAFAVSPSKSDKTGV
jgi:hypothetical protein